MYRLAKGIFRDVLVKIRLLWHLPRPIRAPRPPLRLRARGRLERGSPDQAQCDPPQNQPFARAGMDVTETRVK